VKTQRQSDILSHIFSASLSISIVSRALMLRNIRLDHHNLSVSRLVCLSVRKVYYGKTANWIQISFGVVSGVGQGIGVLDRGHYRRREGQFLR